VDIPAFATGSLINYFEMNWKKLILRSLSVLGLITFLGCQSTVQGEKVNISEQERSQMRLTGTDALGRETKPTLKKREQNKTVGLFYSLWVGHHNEGIYDIQKLLDSNPDALHDPNNSRESPIGKFHFWGEPLYGYYNMKDPWIVTRHIELLTNAGIDYLCLDATNTIIYPEQAKNLFATLLTFHSQGFDVPKIVFYTNSSSGTTVDNIYTTFYQSGDYEDIWYKPVEKPLIIGITENNHNASDMLKFHTFNDFIKPAMKEYFDVRESQWPNGDYNEDAIPWMSWQNPQWNHKGSVAVPVAQHSHSVVFASSMHNECSRGYNNVTKKVEADWTAGANFQTMWNSVFDHIHEINNVLVTSFNEWMAIKYANEGIVFFVDVYNHEFSRDIEIMNGGYHDNFYMQLVQNCRKFKFEEGEEINKKRKKIQINEMDESQWEQASAYFDFAGDALARNFINAAGTDRYTDNSNRNDIVETKVIHDKRTLYFRINTVDKITPHNGEELNWMTILLQSEGAEGDPSFEGYQYIINRKPKENGITSIEKSTGGYHWEEVGEARYHLNGHTIQISISLASLGLTGNSGKIAFKVSDNVTRYDEIMDYYVTGDSAPLGRLNFSYSYQ
jgi:hypothetical protein